MTIEVNWWTGDRLRGLEKEVQKLLERIKDEQNLLSLIVEQTAPALRQCLMEKDQQSFCGSGP